MSRKNVPNIRFQNFKESWKLRDLFDVAQYRNGKAHEQFTDEHGKYVIVNSKFVSTNGQVKKYSNQQREPLLEGEIAFVLSDIPNGRALARTYLIEKNGRYTLNQRVAGITPKEDISPYYLYMLMDRNRYFLQFDDGAKQTNLSLVDMQKFEDYYPNKEEQYKIGLLFETMDQLIEKNQQKYNTLVTFKQSMYEKMFPEKDDIPPEIRFRGFNQLWETHLISDFSSLKMGHLFSPSDYTTFGKYNVITISNVTGERYIEMTEDTNTIREIPPYLKKHQILQKYDLLISLTGNIGRVSLNVGDYNVLNYRVGKIDIVSQNLDKKFCLSYLSQPLFIHQLVAKGQGGAQPNISKPEFENSKIMVPEIEEQKKIGLLFEKIDELIMLYRCKNEKLINIRKSLLGDMFL